jgi:transposase, IS5 family
MKQHTLTMAADQEAGFAQHYPKAGHGRPPVAVEHMLRIHFLQHGFNLGDLSCEEALYDSASLRRFVGIDLGREPVADATTLLKSGRLLNAHKLGETLFAKVGQELMGQVRS